MISQTVDGVTMRYSTADERQGRPTGLMQLDPVLVQYMYKTPGVA